MVIFVICRVVSVLCDSTDHKRSAGICKCFAAVPEGTSGALLTSRLALTPLNVNDGSREDRDIGPIVSGTLGARSGIYCKSAEEIIHQLRLMLGQPRPRQPYSFVKPWRLHSSEPTPLPTKNSKRQSTCLVRIAACTIARYSDP